MGSSRTTVLEQVHCDHPLRIAVSAGHIAKVSKYGGRVVAFVCAFEREAPEEQSVAARGVYEKARKPGCRRPVGTDCGYSGAPVGPELHLGHASAFEHGCPEAAAVVEQQLVEIGAPDVITVTHAQIWIASKAKCRRLSVFVRNDLGTGHVHADAFDLVGNTE